MIDLDKPVLDLNGVAVEGATIASSCIQALMGQFPDEERLPGEEKLKRFMLAQRITTTPKIDLTSEEVTLIKHLVGKGWPALVVGRVYEVIDPSSVKVRA